MLKTFVISIALFTAQDRVPRDGGQQQQHSESHAEYGNPAAPTRIAPKACYEYGERAERYACYKSKTEEYLKAAAAPADLSNWVLAGLGIVGGIIAISTLRAMKRQADLMDGQLKTMAAGMKQWVDVQVTTSRSKKTYVLGGVDYLSGKIEICFRAANQTSYPLTIQETFVQISRAQVLESSPWQPYTIKETVILSPRSNEQTVIGQTNSGDYNFFVPVDLDEGMTAQYKAHTLMISINGYIVFSPVVGASEKQWFGYLIRCGPDNVHAVPLEWELKKTD